MPFRTMMTLSVRSAWYKPYWFKPYSLFAVVLALLTLGAAPVISAQCSSANGTETTFSNTSTISAPSTLSGPSYTVTTPLLSGGSGGYPSTITVSGLSGTVSCVQVVLNGVSSSGSNPSAQGLNSTQILLEAPTPGNQSLVVLGGVGTVNDYPTDLTMTIGDGYSAIPTSTDIPLSGSFNYAPTSNLSPTNTGFWPTLPINPPSPAPNPLSLSNYPALDSNQTMGSIFDGTTANGTWRLYLMDFFGDPVTIQGGWSLKLWVTAAASTTTTISTNANPVSPTGTVTYTATVTSGGSAISGGTVTFYAATTSADNAYTPITCSGGNQTVSSGTATCQVTLSAASAATCATFGSSNTVQNLPTFPSVCQGNQSIYAAYNGSTSYATSQSSDLTQVIVPTPTQSGNQWCSSSPISLPASVNSGAAYPAIIPVSGYAAGTTVSTVSVSLNDVISNGGSVTDAGGIGHFLLVAPGSGGQNLDFFDDPFSVNGCNSTNFTIDDEAGNYPFEVQNCPSGSASYSPFDETDNAISFPSASATAGISTIPALPATINYAYSGGTGSYGSAANTFAAKFNGAPANGDWSLYSFSASGSPQVVNGGWCITLAANTGVATTTTVTSTQNPVPTNTNVTYTATVTSSGSPVTSGGTVTFLDGTTVPGGTTSGDNVVTLGATGTATFSSSSLYDQVNTSTTSSDIPTAVNILEGDHTINVSYGGNSTDNASSGSVVERINNPTTTTSTGSNTYQACNAGPMYGMWGAAGPFTPNPSVIVPANIPGTINTVSLTLNNFYYSNAGSANSPISDLESLLVGPTGKALDFYSGAGTSELLTEGAYTFSDSGATAPSSGTISPGTYLPTSANSGNDTFVSSASGFYTLPTLTASNYAQPKGSATFGSTFGNTNPNGNWGLYFNTTNPVYGIGAVNGWCLNFTENPVTVSATLSHSGTGTGGDFVQSQTGASITVNVDNSGSTGPTGDPSGTNPLTVTDTLNSALTYSGYTGSGWTCTNSSPTVTCKNDSAVAQGSSYPPLTLNVSVSGSAPSSISNSVNVSGAGTTPTASNTDIIPVDATPVLAVILTDGGGFKQGGTGQWIITVSNTAANGATSGAVTVTDALPFGYTLSGYTSSGGLWTCSGTSTVTCTATPGLTAGSSSVITLTVNIPVTSALSVSDVASAYGGGDTVHTSLGTAATSNTDTVSVAAAQLATTLTVSANPASITYGQPVTLTATLAPYTNEGNSSNGENVTFYNGGSSLGTGALTNGVATLATTTLPIGTDTITATYGGDTYLLGSTTATPATVTVTTPNFVVTTATDDAGASANCTPQASTTTGTDTSCSLRDALLAAAGSTAGNIYFSSTAFSSAQTITLTNGTLTIPANTAIYGATSGSGSTLTNLVTVSGGGTYTVFTANGLVSIANLNIVNGNSGSATAAGGGITNNGALTVNSVNFTGNSAQNGGGIFNGLSSTLSVINSTFSGNSAQQEGGGIDNDGHVTVTNSTFSGNSAHDGGGISSALSTAPSIINSTFFGNTAQQYGGGIIDEGSPAGTKIYNNIVSGNTSGAGVADDISDQNGVGDLDSQYATGHGNVVDNSSIQLAPLANYDGPTKTMIPLPGSPAICAGLAADIASGVTTDQRGEPNKNTSYPGYNSTTPCVDAGAAQTNYAISFTQQPSNVAASEVMSPAPTVMLTESRAAFADGTDAIPIPLTITSGTLSGGTASTDSSLTSPTKGVATYSSLSVNTANPGDTLTASLSLNPNLSTPLSLTQTSNPFNVTTGVTATPSISSESLTENHAATAFTPVTGSGGTGTLTYSISPTLPTGLSLSASTGTISGTPTAVSSAITYTVTVTDQNSATATANFSLTVNAAVAATQAIASKSLTQNHAATAFTPVTGSSGTGTLTYSISPTLPAGLSLSASTGAISGTPTAVSSATPYTITVTDQNSATATASFSLTVNSAVVATQAIASKSLTQNRAATAFTPVTGSSGTGTLTYSVSPTLPAGLSLNASTGTITGTPTAVSSAAPYAVTVTDQNSATATANFSLTVNAAVAATQVISSASLTENHAVVAFTPVTGSNGTGALTYSISPALPAGLSLNVSTGTITGTPTATQSAATSTVTVTDQNGATATASFTLSVNGPVAATTAIASKSLTVNIVSSSFTPVTGSGGTGALTYSISPTLPAGLSLNASTGAISGTPTAVSSATPYIVTVTDQNSATATASFSLTVNATVAATQAIASETLTYNTAASFTPVTGSGGTTPLSYSISPALPAGLNLNSSTGAITGAPAAAQAATSYTIKVTDANGASATAGVSITVNRATATVALGNLSQTYTGSPLAATATTTPSGLTVNLTYNGSTTAPTTVGSYSVTATINDTNYQGTASGTLVINKATPTISAWPTASSITYGQTLANSTLTGGAASAPGVFTWTTASLSPNVGNQSESVTFTPQDTADYNAASGTVTVVVLQAASLINARPVASAITYGQTLANSTLTGGTASVPGVFAWATPSIAPGAGTPSEPVVFTPTDTAHYTTVTTSVSITVNKATPTLAWSTPSAIPYGTALGAAQLDATASAPGSFTYTPAAGTVLAAGTHTLLAGFTPTDATDYNTPASVSVNLSVTAVALNVAANNATKTYGTANPSFTGSVNGAVNGDAFTESFTTGATASSPVGTYAIVPSVTGADLSDYTVATTNGTLSVTQAASSLALAASASNLTPGQSLTLTVAATDATPNSTGTPGGTIVFLDGTTQIGTAALSNGAASISINTLTPGVSHSLTATYAGDANFTGSSVSAPVSITVGTLDFTFTPPSNTNLNITSGGTATTSFTITPTYGSYQGQVTFSATGLPFGATVTFSPTSIPANTGTPQTVTLTIHLAQPVGATQHASRSWRSGAPLVLGLLVLPFATLRRLRKSLLGRVTMLIVLAAAGLAGAASLSGCAAVSGFNAESTQNYTVTVTAQAGSVTHSFQFDLNVQ